MRRPQATKVSQDGFVPPEKTRRLLFRGAKAYMDHGWEEGCAVVDLPESPKPGPMEAPRATRGQMLIGPDGRLTRRGAQAFEAGEWRAGAGHGRGRPASGTLSAQQGLALGDPGRPPVWSLPC